MARPGPERTRLTLFNARLNIRHVTGEVERRTPLSAADYRAALTNLFGIDLPDHDLAAALAIVEAKAARGAPHPFFA